MEITTIHFKSGSIKTTDKPVIYSGNYLLIGEKETKDIGDGLVVINTVIPYDLGTISKIIIRNKTKQYTQYADQ
jgi:hypothetical protein